MSLLLAVSSAGSISGAVSENQKQLEAIQAQETFSGTVSETQRQTESIAAAETFSGSVTETQSQTELINAIQSSGISGIVSESQGQTEAIYCRVKSVDDAGSGKYREHARLLSGEELLAAFGIESETISAAPELINSSKYNNQYNEISLNQIHDSEPEVKSVISLSDIAASEVDQRKRQIIDEEEVILLLLAA